MNDKIRTVNIADFQIDIYDFGYKKYMYPAFNHNAEFEVSKSGFKRLYRYLRNVRWINNISKQIF